MPPTEPRDEPQPCCHDGVLTHRPIEVGSAYSAAGAGTTVYACPDHAQIYQALKQAERAS